MRIHELLILVLAVLLAASCRSDSADERPWETEEEQPDVVEVVLSGLQVDPSDPTIPVGTAVDLSVIASYDDGSTATVTDDVRWTVGNDEIVGIEDSTVTARSPGSTAVRAAYDGYTAEALVTVPSARPDALEISPAAANLAIDETVQLRAELFLTDGTSLPADELVDWSSSDANVATVSNDPGAEGLVRGLTEGMATITARLADVEAEATITVGSAGQLVGIELAPAVLRMVPDQTARVEVLGRYADGRVSTLTTVADLRSTTPDVAMVAGSGVITALIPGETRIEAELQGYLATADVEVTDALVTGLELSPAQANTTVGGAVDFAATALLDDGTTLDFDRTVDWRTSDPAVATVERPGIAIGRQPGVATIEARFGEHVADASLDVIDAELRGIDVEPLDPTGLIGSRWAFRATGRYDGGIVADLTYSCDWSSSNPAMVAIQPDGGAEALAVGTAIVTCDWLGVRGRTTIEVGANDLESLSIEPVAVTLGTGESTMLAVVGRHADGRTTDLTESATWTSDANAVAVSNQTGNRGQVTARAVGNAEIRADFGGLFATSTVRVSDAELTAITVDPTPVSVPVGGSVPVVATGSYADGTEREVTRFAQWSVSDATLARVGNGSSAGVVEGIAPGGTTVTARVGGIEATVPVYVTSAAVSTIEIEPADLVTTRGLRTNYEAWAVYTDGQRIDVTDEATWSVDDPSLAFIGNSNPRGQLVALEVGATVVRARWDGAEGTTSLTIEGPQLDSLAITPVVARAAVGIDTQLVATATYTDGSSRNVTAAAVWSSDRPGIAEPNDFGLVEPRQAGEAQITAQYGGLSATTTFTVTDASIVQVDIVPFQATIAAGDQMWFQAVAIFSDGTRQNVTRLAVWNSTEYDIVEVASVAYLSGVALAKQPGEATILANYEGVTGEAQVTVTDATVVEIEIFPTVYELAVGTEVFMTAQALYSDGSARNINYLGTWTSSEPAVAEIRNAWPSPGLVTANAPGETTITIQYQGVSATAEITVSDASLESIQVFPFSSSITVGAPVWFQATGVFTDGRSVNLTRTVTWTSSNDTVAAISNGRWSEGRTIGVAPGQTTIEATWQGVTGSASVVVVDKQIATIQISPFIPRVPAGYGEFFQAVAIFDDATSRNVTQIATWETTDPMIASVGNVWWTNGLVLTHEPGQVAVSATWQGVEGTTSLTVTDALLSAIEIEPADMVLNPGDIVEYTAMGQFDDGTEMDITLFSTWLSTDTSVADVSNAWGYRGEATAFAPGTTDISANDNGVSASTSLTVQ